MRVIHLVALTGFAICMSLTPTQAAENAFPIPKIGEAPPMYVGRPLGGDDVTIDPSDGRVYVISFWASWCGPCRQELPVLANIQQIAGPDRIKVVAVNIEDREVYRDLQKQITKMGLTSTYDPTEMARKAYGVGPIPHMVIVGRDGKISAIRTGYSKAGLDSLADQLNQALSTPLTNPGKTE